jgi:hypothetical protein
VISHVLALILAVRLGLCRWYRCHHACIRRFSSGIADLFQSRVNDAANDLRDILERVLDRIIAAYIGTNRRLRSTDIIAALRTAGRLVRRA